MKKSRELTEDLKVMICNRIDKGEKSKKIAEELGVDEYQVRGVKAWHLHRDSWA
jgi:DNA-directed RNA polymerase subunit N (RpoN/RPB10)